MTTSIEQIFQDPQVLAITGEEPERTPEKRAGLGLLESMEEIRGPRLVPRYYIHQGQLHSECFYNGHCDSPEDIQIHRRCPAVRRSKCPMRRFMFPVAVSSA